jgi:hypothetical protein
MSTAAGPPESDSRTVSNIREGSNIQQGHQQQQELTTRTVASEPETIGTSQTSTIAEERPATGGMPEIVEVQTEPEFLNFLGAQESIPRNQFRQPM